METMASEDMSKPNEEDEGQTEGGKIVFMSTNAKSGHS